MDPFTADYVIVGAGAVGMAFADTLLSQTDADLIIIDRHPAPGGHWNIAYPYVTLHQPSAYFGVESTELSGGRIESHGLNKGLNELATGAELLAYYDRVMKTRFLPSGRVRYLPMSEFSHRDGSTVHFSSRISGQARTATATRKVVDATHLTVSVPANHTPNFEVAAAVDFIPLNDLPKLSEPPEHICVIGGGKTGMDACLWLLEHGTDPDRISWVVPRDGWMLDRKNTQPTPEFFTDVMSAQAAYFEGLAEASDLDDLFARLERGGYLLRIDPHIEPEMFHGATVSQAEISELARIKHVIRMGRISHIEPGLIHLRDGTYAMPADTLYVDCSARAIENANLEPVFTDGLITPKMVRAYQPAFSASLIAYVEANYDDDKIRNRLCAPVPLPNGREDFLRFSLMSMTNQFHWSQDKTLQRWIVANRLDGFGKLVSGVQEDESDKIALLMRLRSAAPKAVQNTMRLLSELAS